MRPVAAHKGVILYHVLGTCKANLVLASRKSQSVEGKLAVALVLTSIYDAIDKNGQENPRLIANNLV
jgi:hypothetical protein